jgi:hypothetical protein
LGKVDVNEAVASLIRKGGNLPLHPELAQQKDGFVVVHQQTVLALSQRTERGLKSIRL